MTIKKQTAPAKPARTATDLHDEADQLGVRSHAARRVRRGGRIVILPPLESGNFWGGSSGRH